MKLIFQNSTSGYHLKKSLMVVGFLCCAFSTYAQLMFEKDYSNFVRIRKMAITSDGGTIVAGKSAYLGNNDMAMMKLGVDGNVEWAHAYGNGTEDDQAESVMQTLDGGYILVGSTGTNCYTVKTNSLGGLQWQKTHTPSTSKRATDVTQLPDSSYIITVGSSIASSSISSDAGYMRLDKTGNLLWSKSYSSVSWTCCDYNPNLYRALKLRNSSSILMIGSYMGGNNSQVYFRKVNPAGTKLLEKRFLSGSGFGFLFNGIQTADGHVVMVGYSMAAKIDTSGNVIWAKEYSSVSGNAIIQAVAELPNGNLVMYEIHSDGYPYLIETTSLGVALSSVRLTGMNNATDRNYNMCTMLPTPDGALIIGFENTIKKFPLTISSACSSVSYTFSTSSLNPTLNDPNLTIATWTASPVKTFVDGNVVSTPTTACSSTYCPVVSQPAAISGAATACAGTSVTYSVAAVSGATSYSWALPGTWSGTSTGNSITVTVGTSGGNITVAAVNSCTTSSSRTLAVTVNPSASVPGAISGPAVLCAGTTDSYSVAPVSGATSYSWALPGGWSGTSSTNSITVTANASGGTISVASVNGCGVSANQTYTVAVNTIPAQPFAISGNTITCSGMTGSYSVAPVSGATSYSWALPGGWTGTGTSNTISVTAGAAGGNISVAASNNCGTSASQSLALTIGSLPAMPSAIAGSTMVCPSSSNTYSVALVSGATSYSWSLPGSWSGSSTNNTISVAAGASGGTISVASVNGCGTSSSQVLAVSIGSSPAIPLSISGNTVFCPGSSISYSVAAVSGATSYNWSLPGGWSGSSTTNSIQATAGAAAGTISVTAVNACGTSAAQTQALSLGSAPPMPGAVSGNTVACAGSSNAYAVSPVSGANAYVWTLPSGWSGTSTTATINAVAGTSGGNIQVAASNGCGTSAAHLYSVTIISSPVTPSAISGSTIVCPAASSIYSVSPVSGAGSYSWILPSGFSGTSTSNVIVITAGGSGGAMQVTANNSCGSSGVQSLAVLVSALPNVQAGSSHPMICAGETATLSANGASTYAWSTGATTSSIVVSPGAMSSYTVSGTSAAGCVNSAVVTQSVSACTGIEEIDVRRATVYPNPTQGLFTITSAGGLKMTVLSVFGQEIAQAELPSGKYSLSLEKEPAGIYFIYLTSATGSHVIKLIKE